ncbi:D-alanyl-D-alanine carboxypeptidase/D-alanyl-D-alanine-endopeptidase [Hyphomonas sp.]|uniref:D-alanyl-D-alanine carboxypeptidase/D-alanyl-D-alanine endopeptidase n=1 Tax=Hyphomonas sp. TaxID=87 RepID=UPI0025C4A220|nr:D-alanyl-D-alanine carboxypeptidase/D-alanyl-D-alanine-endopeptidase [Hyphomonas sp.]
MLLLRMAALVLGLAVAACAVPPAPVPAREPVVIAPAQGVRLGVMVATLSGEPVFADKASERFIPASNTKLFTTAATFHLMRNIDRPDPALGTSLRLIPGESGAAPSLILVGAGDPTLRDAPDCLDNCLRQLADAVAARGITRVTDVYGDDTLFPFEPWGMGWSWNNLPFYFGAPVSALTVNGNAAALRVGPDTAEGAPVMAAWAPGDDVLTVRNEAVTGPLGSKNLLSVLRWPGSDEVVLTGSLPSDAAARNYFLSVPEPAQTAAERLVRLLLARGIAVEGSARVRSRSEEVSGEEIARLVAPPLLQSIVYVSEDSDNLAAELLLRHIALATGGEGAEDGLDAVHTMLDEAGIGRAEIELFDGSGLSPYNRVTPQSTVRFLTWTTSQPWGEAFRGALPVGGKTGSLSRRFRGTPLEGRLFAKTGTVQGVNALSGFLIAASGETLVFSVIANDRPADANSVLPVIDKLLVEIAAAN